MAMNIDPRFADQLIQIQTRFLSKKDLIRFMKCHLFLFLPSDSHTTLFFLQQVIRGQKRVKKQTVVSVVRVPLWPELAVRHIYPQAMRIPGLNSYMPDEWNHARRVDRKFFWALLSTLHADYVQALIRGAQETRNAHRAQRQVPRQLLQPTPEWINELLQDNGFVPAGGRRVGPGLLQQRAIRQPRAPRPPVAFAHNVDVDQYIAHVNGQQVIAQAQPVPAPQQQQQAPPEEEKVPEVNPVDDAQSVRIQNTGADLGTGILDNAFDVRSNADSFSTVQQQFVVGGLQQENQGVMGGNGNQIEFQSANGTQNEGQRN